MRRGRRCAGSPAPPHRAAPRFRPGPRRRVVRPSPRRGRDGARRARGSAPDGPGAPPRPRSPWRGGPRGAQGRGREEPARACAYRTMGMVLKTLDRYLLKELFRPFVLAACVVSGAVAFITLIAAPAASGAFQNQLFQILQTKATTGIKERTFTASFNQMVMYVEDISASQVALRGLLVSDERDP